MHNQQSAITAITAIRVMASQRDARRHYFRNGGGGGDCERSPEAREVMAGRIDPRRPQKRAALSYPP